MNELLLRRRFAATSTLPYDAEVEYLESTGTQYINTLVDAGSNCKFDLDISKSSSIVSYLMGCYEYSRRFAIYIRSTSGNIRWRCGGASDADIRGVSIPVDTKVNFNNLEDAKTLVYNYNNSATGGNILANLPIFLFACNNGGSPSGNTEAKVYKLKIYKSEILVRDYIPVRVGTVGYLYDKVSGQLFGNDGTGDFVLGNDKI